MKFCLLFFSLFPALFASLPVNQERYELPRVFQFEKHVIYGKDEAEIYLSLKALTSIKGAMIRLEFSHPEVILLDDSSVVRKEGSRLPPLKAGESFRVVLPLRIAEDFRISVVKFELEFPYPGSWAREQVLNHHSGQYKEPVARQDLIRRIDASALGTALEYTGIYLYNEKRMKDE